MAPKIQLRPRADCNTDSRLWPDLAREALQRELQFAAANERHDVPVLDIAFEGEYSLADLVAAFRPLGISVVEY